MKAKTKNNDIQVMETSQGHKAIIKTEPTPKLLTPCKYHISIYSNEPGKTKEVIYRNTVFMPKLAEALVLDFVHPK
jgi:hypothetical protein